MKNTINALALIFITSLALNSQTSVAPFIGISSSQTTINTSESVTDFINLKSLTKLNVGLLVDHALDQNLDFRSGVIYSQKGFTAGQITGLDVFGLPLPLGVKVENVINYIEVPLALKFVHRNSNIKPYIGAGVTIGYAISGSIDTKATAIIDFNLTSTSLNLSSPDYNRVEASITGLAGLDIPYNSGTFFTEVNYNYGLTEFISDNFVVDAGGKHKDISLRAGYKFSF